MSSNPSSQNSSFNHGVNKNREQLAEHTLGPRKGASPAPITSERKQNRQMTPAREANTEVGRRGPSEALPPRMGEISSFPQRKVHSGSSSNPGTQSSSGKSSDERGSRSFPKISSGPSSSHDTRGGAALRHGQKNSSKASVSVNRNNDLQRPMVLAWQLTQTMSSDANLWCYKIAATEPSKNGAVAESRLPTTVVDHLLKTKLVGTKGCIFTDYQKYLVSTVQLGEHIEAKDSDSIPIKLRSIGKMAWSTMLKFLDSAKFPDDSLREPLKALLNVLICRMNQSQEPNLAEQKSFKVLDVKHTMSTQRKSLATVIQEFLAEDPKNLRRLETYLKGRQVQVSYQKRPDSTRISKDSVEKRIVGLARVEDAQGSKVRWPPKVVKYGASSDHVSFFIKPNRKGKIATASTSKATITNRYATVAEYFEKNKDHRLNNPDLPVINVGTRRKPIYLPSELCDLGIPASTISEMDHNNLEAFARTVGLQDLLDNRNIKRESLAPGLKLPPGFGALNCYVDVTVASTLTPCRLLESPRITYAGGKTIDTTCGSWETNHFNFGEYQSGQPRRLAMLRFSPSQTAEVMKKEEETLSSTLKSGTLRDKLQKYDILLDENTPIETISMPSGKPNKAERKSIEEKLKTLATPKSGLKPHAVLVVLPKKQQSVYDCVKHECDTVLGIQSFCVVMYQLTSERDGYYSQIGLKLNLKFKGENQVLKMPDFKCFTLGTTMVVGIDAMNPPTGSGEHAKGIATMVASKDESLSQWPASVEVVAKEPVHTVFTRQLEGRVKYWKDKNGKYPSNVIVYRNGSSARNGHAFSEEVSSIETYLSKVTNSKPPTLTFIAVSKDHNAQFRTPESLTRNPEAQEIPAKPVLVRTREREGDKTWEFVIQGHTPMKKKKYEEAISQHSALKASQATLPVRYSVLKTGLFTEHEARKELEDLTHMMCYLSGHGTSYVTETLPIHYVGLLCKRTHSYVRPWYYPRNGGALQTTLSQTIVQPHRDIADTMFYV